MTIEILIGLWRRLWSLRQVSNMTLAEREQVSGVLIGSDYSELIRSS
jgi:hypothetical protein